MNFSVLPESLRPGTDLVSKSIVQEPTVINIITNALLKVQDDYVVANSEWENGSRSDVILEAKSSVLNLPPIIVETQHIVNSLFIKRAINYSLEAFKRYKMDPIFLIICTDTLSNHVVKDVKTSNIPACYNYSSIGWASLCLIACKARVQEYVDTVPMDPFVALYYFLTSWAITINDTLYQDDPTIQYLYTWALEKHQSRLGDQHIADIVAQILETQDHEHTKILRLIDKNASSEAVVEAIKTLQSQNHATKRKLSDINIDPSSIPNSTPTTTTTTITENVENYKETRAKKGFKRMDWLACYSKGVELNLFRYRNADVLRNQFNKYMKQKH